MPERSDAEMRGWFEETRFRRFQRRFQRHHWLLLCMWTPLGLLLALAKLALLLFACFFVVLIGFYGGERALRHDGRSNGGHHDGGVYGALVWLVRALTLRRVAEAAGIPPSRGLRNPRGVRAAPRCSALLRTAPHCSALLRAAGVVVRQPAVRRKGRGGRRRRAAAQRGRRGGAERPGRRARISSRVPQRCRGRATSYGCCLRRRGGTARARPSSQRACGH